MHHAYKKEVSAVEKTIFNAEVAIVLFFDVEGAFDKAGINHFCNLLQARDMVNQPISWIKSVLNHATVDAGNGDSNKEMRVNRGCPQVSCRFPLLWNLKMDRRLQRLETSI